ncbi:MAG: hypothetical protein E7649_01085 [Ruminococcaceae bacterium]|nr:hypothetical protein [Oscillospiraceae bacterium]
MNKLKVGAGAFLMLVAVILSERASVFLIYGACAVLHELGHLAAAWARGIEVEEIRIDISGARICTRQGAGSYADELILCMSGPMVNVAIVATGLIAARLCELPLDRAAQSVERLMLAGEITGVGALSFFVLCAAVQGAMNLLPIKTFDGGRMLYCFLAMTANDSLAERIVGVTGGVCAFAIWTVAMYLMIRIGAGLGIYVFCACLFFSTLRDGELVKN